ncbi:hypothetical protein SDC9_136383 [bioreactor metagenome]|uniref:Uncharacterized protein n=1 Tax=bioreactor metagenome TaxID=1076179 RepID=A0A645DJ48_9ZZZZ
MCRAVRCHICGKTTWAGCGQHIDQVRRTVADEHWCDGHAPQRTKGRFASLFNR